MRIEGFPARVIWPRVVWRRPSMAEYFFGRGVACARANTGSPEFDNLAHTYFGIGWNLRRLADLDYEQLEHATIAVGLEGPRVWIAVAGWFLVVGWVSMWDEPRL